MLCRCVRDIAFYGIIFCPSFYNFNDIHVSGEGPANYLRFVRIIFVIQLALGIAQLICGGMGVKYTKGQTDTFGAPYFTGAFIVGVLVSYADTPLSTSPFSPLIPVAFVNVRWKFNGR